MRPRLSTGLPFLGAARDGGWSAGLEAGAARARKHGDKARTWELRRPYSNHGFGGLWGKWTFRSDGPLGTVLGPAVIIRSFQVTGLPRTAKGSPLPSAAPASATLSGTAERH
ncbi:hypothetical protein GCM10010166_26590 [Couchioplanes caeruleus subsp. azureus]|nr:hypothetical protein GCM10010166_26590 [Couchioplanes caeruleus subsp. azureus]